MNRPYDKRNRWMIDYVPVKYERAKLGWREVVGAILSGALVAMMLAAVMYC